MSDHPRPPDHSDLPTQSLPQVETPSRVRAKWENAPKAAFPPRSRPYCARREAKCEGRMPSYISFDLWTRFNCLFRLLILVLRLFDRVAAAPPSGKLGKPPVLFCQGLKGVQLLSEG